MPRPFKKEPNDIPIHRKCHLLEAVVTIRKSSSITQLSDDAGNLSKLLWSQLEQYDNWYHNDIILAGTLLSHMLSLDVIDDTAKLILERLENTGITRESSQLYCHTFNRLLILSLNKNSTAGLLFFHQTHGTSQERKTL